MSGRRRETPEIVRGRDRKERREEREGEHRRFLRGKFCWIVLMKRRVSPEEVREGFPEQSCVWFPLFLVPLPNVWDFTICPP